MYLDHRGNVKTNTVDKEVLPGIFGDLFSVPDEKKEPELKTLARDLTDLELHIDDLDRMLSECVLCEKKCHVNRMEGGAGLCGIPGNGYIYQSQLSYGEENMISPTYEIYFAGCNLSCNFCHQNNDHNYDSTNIYLDIEDVIDDIKQNKSQINTISYLGGNPDQSLSLILRFIKALEDSKLQFPHVLNSNFLFSEDVTYIINGHFDLFIPDFKFGNDKCASKISGCKRYVDIVQRNILNVHDLNPIIIRHMPIPGHWDCCTKPVIDWIAQNDNKMLRLSLLDSFYIDNSSDLERAKEYSINKGIHIL